MLAQYAAFILAATGLVIPISSFDSFELTPNIKFEEVSGGEFRDRALSVLSKDFSVLGYSGPPTCTHVYRFIDSAITSREASFGAFCSIRIKGRELKLLVCDDFLVGEFTMTSAYTFTPEAAANFVKVNCPQG